MQTIIVTIWRVTHMKAETRIHYSNDNFDLPSSVSLKPDTCATSRHKRIRSYDASALNDVPRLVAVLQT